MGSALVLEVALALIVWPITPLQFLGVKRCVVGSLVGRFADRRNLDQVQRLLSDFLELHRARGCCTQRVHLRDCARVIWLAHQIPPVFHPFESVLGKSKNHPSQ